MNKQLVKFLSLFILNKEKRHNFRKKYIKNDLDIIKNDLDIIFKYISNGLELHPEHNRTFHFNNKEITPRYAERLLVSDYRDVYEDHLVRYLYSTEYIDNNDIVLDLACGCGYGSSCIMENSKPKKLIAGDISEAAVEFGKRFFAKQGIEFKTIDATVKENFEANIFTKIVSFETIEHIPLHICTNIVNNFYYWMKEGGKLICSVPNEEVYPFATANEKFHYKHYKPLEFKEYLEKAGFKNIQILYPDMKEYKIVNKYNKKCHHTIIAIAEK